MKIAFVKPDIQEAEIKAVEAVLRSGWITTGPVTKQFEQALADYMGTEKSVCVNSQTMGAELVLRLLGVGPGDEVIVPAYTYTASCSIIYHVGATPVMVDSQKDSPEIDYQLLEEAITPKTKVIIPVDLAGVVCDYDKIYEIIERKQEAYQPNLDNRYQKLFNRIIILADTAHSLGAKLGDKHTGNLADFSSFSFHAVKNLTTAEGGCVTWKAHPGLDSEEVYKTLMLLSLHGQNKDALGKTKAGSWEYDIIEPWYKGNLTDIASAIGLSQLQRYQDMLDHRAEIVRKYDRMLEQLEAISFNHFKPGQTSSYHLYIMHFEQFSLEDRNRFIEEMALAGITCNVHYKPLPLLSAYSKRGFRIEEYPRAYDYYKGEVTLPLYSSLTDEEVDYIVEQACTIYPKIAK